MKNLVRDGTERLEVADLVVEFGRGRGRPPLRAVDSVSLQLRAGETIGLVGESGSGKTTIGRAILGLAKVAGGSILLNGREITHATHRERRRLSRDLQVVFQDPYSSLNPTRTIGQTLSEMLRIEKANRPQTRARMLELFERVGLPADAADRYPAHFSGGQRQRIAIARAVMAKPNFVICDEPTSALDLSVQANVLNLLRELQEEFGIGYLFISHDLAVVRHLSQRIVVLYRGRVMEAGNAEEICTSPMHPYTQALLAAAPLPDPTAQAQHRESRQARTAPLEEPRTPESCVFAARCPHAIAICYAEAPNLEATSSGQSVACHRWKEIRALKTG